LYKNLYSPGEYNIKDTPYKLRGSFLSKADKLKKETDEKPAEMTPQQKTAQANDELKSIEARIEEKKGDLLALEQLNIDLKASAEKEVRQMISDAEKQAVEIKALKEKEGYETGFDKGYYEGLTKGKSEMDSKYSGVVATLQSIAKGAVSEKHKIINNTEEDIVNLSIDIARKVVDQELKVSKDIVVNFVKEAIKMLEKKEKITIYTNPADLELIKSHREDFIALTDINEALHILPDDMLEPGECRLESENQIVDTDLDYQFGEIKKNLHSAD
jgi:flagellar assembly protein FliH